MVGTYKMKQTESTEVDSTDKVGKRAVVVGKMEEMVMEFEVKSC